MHASATRQPHLITPGQAGYGNSVPWNRAVASEPAAVIEARNSADVADAVRHAADHDLRVAVRSSGHGAVPVDGSTLLVHTAAMADYSVDPVRRVVRLGAGVRWQPVLEAAARYGLAPICGSSPGIGAVGYLTGGGIGPLARTFGVSSDFVRAIEVVVGDGRVLRATPTQHEELFWGLRGGKATLGIVTSLEMELVRLDSFYGGALWFDVADTRPVLSAWRQLCADLPNLGTTSAAIMRLPKLDVLPAPIAGRQTVAIRYGWVGDPDDGAKFLREIRRAATPVLDDVRARPYTQIGAVHSDPVAPAPVVQRSALLGEICEEALDGFVEATRVESNRQNIVELRRLGGAIADTPPNPSAVCHRDAAYSLFIAGTAGADVDEVAAHAAQVLSTLAPWTEPGLLPNFAASDDPAEIRRYYDKDTLHWLQELGEQYDPAHVLHTGQVARRPLPPR
jgi:FAD/FMN-containing dehydrogenase